MLWLELTGGEQGQRALLERCGLVIAAVRGGAARWRRDIKRHPVEGGEAERPQPV